MDGLDQARREAHEYFKTTAFWTFVFYGLSLVFSNSKVLVVSLIFCGFMFSFRSMRDSIDLEKGGK